MVFRRRSRNNLRPIDRVKHVVDFQFAAIAGTAAVNSLIAATDTPVLGGSNQVITGSTVNGIYLKVEIHPVTSASLPNAYLLIFKNPGGNLTIPVPNAVGTNDNKRYAIHQEMVMLQKQDDGNPRTLFNGVIAIPKGYRRFGPNDLLSASVFSPGVNLNACIQCHYKEFR